VSAKGSDLSVTALYTSAAWSWGGLANAELFDHPNARRVFRTVNAVLGMARPFIGVEAPLPIALLHRHTLIDALLRLSGTRHVLELAAGLSRRGVTFSADPAFDYIEIDRPSVVAQKRQLLERTTAGQAALARTNFHLIGGDVKTVLLDQLCPPNGEPLSVIAEGLMMYLDADAQRSLGRSIADRLGQGGGTFVFDFVPPSELPGPGPVGAGLGWLMKRFTGGEGFARDERARDEVVADFRSCGFDGVEIIEPRKVAEAWGLPHPEARTQQLVFVAHVDPKKYTRNIMRKSWLLAAGLLLACSSSSDPRDMPGAGSAGATAVTGAAGSPDTSSSASSSTGSAGATGNAGGSGNGGSASMPDGSPAGGAGGATDGATPDASSGTSTDASSDARQACASFAATVCSKLESCAPFVLGVLYGDAATCRDRTALGCVPTFGAPGTSATPAKTAACDKSIAALTCPSFLAIDLGAACKTDPGTVATGAACGDDAQCDSTFCARTPDATCGICQPPTSAGSACVRNSCSAGTVCPAGQSKCITPVAGKVDDACTAQEQCDLAHAVGCNVGAGKCLALTAASSGACGANSIFPTSYAVCPASGTCSAPLGGRCSAAAKDGDACSTADTGTHCLPPARCVGGRCTVPDPSKCQ